MDNQGCSDHDPPCSTLLKNRHGRVCLIRGVCYGEEHDVHGILCDQPKAKHWNK